MLKRFLLFLLINFAALAIGGLSTRTGTQSSWYLSLEKAPWTPPGWVFGAVWTLIMLCFAVYMAYLYTLEKNTKLLLLLFGIQCLLNVVWNPVFFSYQMVLPGLIIISLLTVLVGHLFFYYMPDLRAKSIFIAPYFIWLLIATSLNAYIYFNN